MRCTVRLSFSFISPARKVDELQLTKIKPQTNGFQVLRNGQGGSLAAFKFPTPLHNLDTRSLTLHLPGKFRRVSWNRDKTRLHPRSRNRCFWATKRRYPRVPAIIRNAECIDTATFCIIRGPTSVIPRPQTMPNVSMTGETLNLATKDVADSL